MPKSNKARMRYLGSAAVMALFGAMVGPAQAVETQFGDVMITFDTTVSVGASMRVAQRNKSFLNESNGGPVDPREFGVTFSGPATFATFGLFACGLCTATTHYSANPNNFDGSINADDGRLNWNSGDLTGANVKASHELQMQWENYKVFVRAVGFYDVILNDGNSGERSTLDDKARGRVGRNYNLLDAFVSADYRLGQVPINVRLGKQVINWGESTFILNGNNVFDPIDVAAFRRPGSEIKEALLPVTAVYGSVSLPWDMSVAGYYALDWQPFKLDPAGSPFSQADVIPGTGFGGNNAAVAFVTGSPFSGDRRNCGAVTNPGMAGTRFVQTSGLLNDPVGGVLGNNLLECSDNPFVNYSTPLPQFKAEQTRISKQKALVLDGMPTPGTEAILTRGADHTPGLTGDFGLKVSYYSEALNGTEFAGYYQNYSSRLPYAGLQSTPGGQTSLGFFVNSNDVPISSGVTGRALNALGCGLTHPGDFGTLAFGGPTFAGGHINNTLNFGLSATAQTWMKTHVVNDPGNILPTAAAAVALQSAGAVTLFNAGGTIGFKNEFAMAQLNCVLAYYQSGFVNPNPGNPACPSLGCTVQSSNGAEFLVPASDGQVYFDYPTGIDIWGTSVATTVGDWGVQGEISYRPRAPFQVDTDSLTIASLIGSCLFDTLYGAAGGIVDGLGTPDGTGVKPFCGNGVTRTKNFIENEMVTAQVGTTATYTSSVWWMDATGADLGILVTEVGAVYVPGVERSWIDNLPAAKKTSVAQYANTGCQGSDLPAGGILALDFKHSYQCRPTDWSAGLVVLFVLQYNNAFNTGFVVSPTIAYTYDFMGTTPSPYGNYLEDRQALNLGVSGTLNNNFKLGVNYTNYFGGHIQNKSRDLDNASVSASYTF